MLKGLINSFNWLLYVLKTKNFRWRKIVYEMLNYWAILPDWYPLNELTSHRDLLVSSYFSNVFDVIAPNHHLVAVLFWIVTRPKPEKKVNPEPNNAARQTTKYSIRWLQFKNYTLRRYKDFVLRRLFLKKKFGIGCLKYFQHPQKSSCF